MLSCIQDAAILRHWTSDVTAIVYVTGALLEKAKLGEVSRLIVIVM